MTVTGPEAQATVIERSLVQSTAARMTSGRVAVTAGALTVAAVVLVMIPYLVDTFTMSLVLDILVLGVLALSTDLLAGVAGLPSLGQAAYYGVGGYTAALVAIHVTSSAPFQLVVAMVAGAVAAALTGWIAVRTRGVYFLMLTLAVGQVFYSLAISLVDVTHGSDGIAGLPPPMLAGGFGEIALGAQTYWYMLVVAVLTLVGVYLVTRLPFGNALRGIRQNEPRMRALGFPTSHYKYAAFTIAGGIAGIAGSLQVVDRGYFSPDDLTYQVSTLALFAAVIGGRGSLLGAFGGAAVIILVRDYIAGDTGGHGQLVLGALFVAVVFVLPQGLAGALRSGRARLAEARQRHSSSAGSAKGLVR